MYLPVVILVLIGLFTFWVFRKSFLTPKPKATPDVVETRERSLQDSAVRAEILSPPSPAIAEVLIDTCICTLSTTKQDVDEMNGSLEDSGAEAEKWILSPPCDLWYSDQGKMIIEKLKNMSDPDAQCAYHAACVLFKKSIERVRAEKNKPKTLKPLCQYGKRCYQRDPVHKLEYSHSESGLPDDLRELAVTDLKKLELCSAGGEYGRASKMDDSYDWIRNGRGHVHYEARKKISCQTLAACHHGGYRVDNKNVALPNIRQKVQETRVVRFQEPFASPGATATTWSKCNGLALEVAYKKAQLGCRVGVVNAASAYHACGGFFSGGRHALEEAMCTQTTLSQSLDAIRQSFPTPHYARPQQKSNDTPWQRHIPEDGVILSPHVTLFRYGSGEGYPFFTTPVDITVLSLAMPNRNPKVSDSPVDSPDDEQEYEVLITKKFHALAQACILDKVTHLVIDSPGCGVFGNDAEQVGRIFGELIRKKFPNAFTEICLLGNDKFKDAAAEEIQYF